MRRSSPKTSTIVVSTNEEGKIDKIPTKQPQLYRPAIVEYKCYGRLNIKPNTANTTNNSHALSCTGYFFRLPSQYNQQHGGVGNQYYHHHNYPPMTKERALQDFAMGKSPNHPSIRHAQGFGGGGRTTRHNTSQPQQQPMKEEPKKTDTTEIKNASSKSPETIQSMNRSNTTNKIINTTTPGFHFSRIIDPKWMDLQSTVDEDDDDDSDDDVTNDRVRKNRSRRHTQRRHRQQQQHQKKEEEDSSSSTTLPPGSHFSFYGSTVVSTLLLSPVQTTNTTTLNTNVNNVELVQKDGSTPLSSNSKEQESQPQKPQPYYNHFAYAICPEHQNGLAVRNILHDTNNTSLSSSTRNRHIKSQEVETQRSMKTLKIGGLEVSMVTQSIVDTTTQQKHDHEDEESTTTSKTQSKSTNNKKEESKTPQEELTEYLNKLYNLSTKLERSMVQNATFLKNELQDEELFNRLKDGSGRVVDQFGKTLGRMQGVVVKVYRFWSDGDDDDDDYDDGY